jgi:hypothetical protein
MTELAHCADRDAAPECLVESKSKKPVGESILHAADTLRAALLIMGLRDSACGGGDLARKLEHGL